MLSRIKQLNRCLYHMDAAYLFSIVKFAWVLSHLDIVVSILKSIAMCTLLPHVTGHLILTKSGLRQFSKQLHCYLAKKGKLEKITLPKDDASSGYVAPVRGTHTDRLLC